MPDTPEEDNEKNSFYVPPVKSHANQQQKNRRENKTPPKAFEQGAITISSDHSREMVAHCAKRGDKNVNVLCAPARLRQQEHRHQKKRRPDVKNQVAPAVENPQCLFRCSFRHSRNSLWS